MICYQVHETYNWRGELVEYKNEKIMPCNTDPDNYDDTTCSFRIVNLLWGYHPGGRYEMRTTPRAPVHSACTTVRAIY